MKRFFASQAWLAFTIGSLLSGVCLGKEDKVHEPKIGHCERKCLKHNIQLQLTDSNGNPVAGTEFWVTLTITKDGPDVTIQLPLINFQTGPSNPGTFLPGGYLYTSDGFLPEEFRPNDIVWRSIVAASNNGLSLPFSFSQPINTLPLPPAGYLVQVTNGGGLVIQCAGTFGNIIPVGAQILLPCEIGYSVCPKETLCENFIISKGFTNITQFNPSSISEGLRPFHMNAAHKGVMVWAWTDNSNIADKANGTLNLMVAVGKVDKEGNVKVRKPIQLTNFPANIQAWTTAVAINPRDPKNIVVSYGITDNVNFQYPCCRAVSFDGGKTWPDPYEYIAFNGSISGNILTVFPDEIFNGTLAVGQNIYAYTLPVGQAGIVPGTIITKQLSGTPGGAGTYQVSPGNQSIPATFIIASPKLNGQIPILNPQSDGFDDNRGVAADNCGNIWYVTNTFFDERGIFTGQPIFTVSVDKGVTFQNVFTLPAPANTSDSYDFPQYCFGTDDTGQYGLYFGVDFVTNNDTIPIIGFIPIFGFNEFGSPSTVELTNFSNAIRLFGGLASSTDGRFWFLGRSVPGAFTNRHLSEVVFKSPGALDMNYAGAWNVAIINENSHRISAPIYALTNAQALLYDDKRQALYALSAASVPDTSQNMRIYFVISRDNGQTWSNAIDIATSYFANRGFQSMALDSKTGDLIFGWYDGRNDPTFEGLQYFGARIPAKKLDKLVESIPLSNPLYTVPPANGASEKSAELLPQVRTEKPQESIKKSLQPRLERFAKPKA